jgi:hypothetical protein
LEKIKMASLTRTSGETFSAVGTPVQFIGKTQKFFAVVVKNLSGTGQNLATENGPDEAVELINNLVTSGASIHAIQVETSSGQISYILDGADGFWTSTTLQAAIRALGTVNSIDCSGTTVTDVGFKLALS